MNNVDVKRRYSLWLALGAVLIALVAMVGCSFEGFGLPSKQQVADRLHESATLPQNEPPSGPPPKMVVPDGIPILMYHMIGPDKDNDAVINEDLFRAQMKLLKDKGFHPITMQELYLYVTEGKPVPEKPVVLTFDDGYKDTYTIVYPLLQEYHFPFTVYVNPGDVGQRMTWEQLKEMHENGVVIANHGFNHVPMDELSREEQKENILKGQEGLKEHLGITNVWFCYPYGAHNSDSQELVKELGLKTAVTMNPGWAHQGSDLTALPRIWIGNAVDLQHFEERITTEHYTDL